MLPYGIVVEVITKLQNVTTVKRRGHITEVCCSKARDSMQKQQSKSSKQLHQVTAEEGDPEVAENTIYRMPSCQSKPLLVDVTINGAYVQMEVDTGATFSISKSTYTKLWSSDRAPSLISASKAKLKTYTGEPIVVEGSNQC